MNSINFFSAILFLAIIQSVFSGGPSSPCNGTKLYDSNFKYIKSVCIFDIAVSIWDSQKACESIGTKLIEAHNPETLEALGVYVPWITYDEGYSYWTTSIGDVCYEIMNDDPWIAYACNCEMNSYYMCEFMDPKA